MDTSGDFNKNDTEQQLQQQQQQQQTTAASIVASMTTATPITSEIISDFEPDPKFDITPLERASYDCQEIYSIESSLDQQEQDEQHQSLSENNDETSQASSSDQQNMQSEQNQEKEQPTQQEQRTAEQKHQTESPQAKQVETKSDDKSQAINDNSVGLAKKTNEAPSLSEIIPSLAASEKNDCNSEKTTQNDTEISLTSAREHPIQLETPNIDLFERIEDHHAIPSVTDKALAQVQGQQQSSNESHMQTQAQLNTEHDMSNLLSLSRQVIDNVVELGDVHQFSQSLGHSETEEKLLDIQSIHRDLISERSSIDLIADVASRQQSIPEIAPVNVSVAQEKQEPCSSSAQGRQEPDLIRSNNISNVSKPEVVTDKPSEIQPTDVNKPTTELHSTVQAELETAETKQDSSQPKLVNNEKIEQPAEEVPQESIIEESVIEEHVTEEPVTEEQVIEETVIDEPIIEEPVESLKDEPVSVQQQLDPNISTTKVVKLEQIAVEPLIPTDQSAKESHLEPLIEEAPSTDDEVPQDVADIETKMETNDQPTIDHAAKSETPSEGEPCKNDAASEDKMEEICEQKSPEPARRRSGRKIKVSEKVEEIERSTTKRLRRAEKMVEKSVTEPVAPEVDQSVKETADASVPEDPTKDLKSTEKTNETTDVSEPVAAETSPSKKVQNAAVEDVEMASVPAAEEETAVDSQDKLDVEPDARAMRVVRERLSRALRPRESVKRAHKEEESEPEPPKIEPPKKQVKKSRGATGESTVTTTSYEAPKNKPSIKLPNYRSRQTISSSDPITRLDKRFESNATPASSQLDSDSKFVCHQCGFATTRLNNLVYHSLRAYCSGKCKQGEVMKADITRQQQTPKSKRKSIR